jgi:hypothetical protein
MSGKTIGAEDNGSKQFEANETTRHDDENQADNTNEKRK